jgi:hypothetical protein
MQLISELLIIALPAVISPIARLIVVYFKERTATKSQTLKITSPSGESRTVRLKMQMSTEENARLVKSLEELKRNSRLPEIR